MLQVEYNINKEENAYNMQQEQQRQPNMVINKSKYVSRAVADTENFFDYNILYNINILIYNF